MKKYSYIFLLSVITLMTACSAEEFTPAGQQPEDEVLIRLGVGAPAYTITRAGTGTVGGTDQNGDANNWNGQHFKVFMINKEGELEHTLDNLEFIAPVGADHGEATIAGTSVPYPAGAHSFYAYHLGGTTGSPTDPEPPTPAQSDVNGAISIPVTIDGSMDVMTATAKDIEPAILASKGLEITDLYSKKSAKAGIHPNMEFSHQLVRFVFNVGKLAGSEAVKIKGVSLKGRNTADIVLAPVTIEDKVVMQWTLEPKGDDVSLSLMQLAEGETQTGSKGLVPLTSTVVEDVENDGSLKQIGEALLMIPGDDLSEYELTITIDNGDSPDTYLVRSIKAEDVEKEGENKGFMQYFNQPGLTYEINLTFKGNKEVNISASLQLQDWDNAGFIDGNITTD